MIHIKSYKDLIVWKKAIELSSGLVSVSPKSFAEQGALSSLYNQLIRSSVSVASNIAEGYTRSGKPDRLKFLNYALSSAAELETQLIILENSLAVNLSAHQEKLLEVQKMLYTLIKRIKQLD